MSAPNAFANECFFDEVAAALKKDPYKFRMELLDPTSQVAAVIDMAAKKANWDGPLPNGQGRGIAGQVEVHIVPDERDPQGVGEMGVPPIVPAVVNAIFNATGKRIRRTPMAAGDL